MDFRERFSRSIWPSKLVLSCYRILPAKWILSFAEEVSLTLCVSVGWGGGLFCRESSLLAAFLNAAFVGAFRLELNQKTAKRLFETSFQCGDMGG